MIIIREMVGSSPVSWSEAAESAVATAARTVRNIRHIEVVRHTARVEDGRIVDYEVELKIRLRVRGWLGTRPAPEGYPRSHKPSFSVGLDDAAMPEAAMTEMDTAAISPVDQGQATDPARDARDEGSPPVILSKLRIPRQRSATLGRGRLLGWLDQHATDRVVVVAAEVGYGKSTLLADYARRSGARCVWYRVEESDGDWISFIGHLVAAIRMARPSFGSSSEALLRHIASVGPSREVVTSSLLAEIGDLPAERTLVVLDDYHLVGDSDDVRSIMRRLFESAPDDWHFAIATRGRPALPIGRLAGQGGVAELTTQDLRFSRAEVAELFDEHRDALPGDVLDVIYDRTQGWAASLQLVMASIAASRPDEIESLHHGSLGRTRPHPRFPRPGGARSPR